MVSLWVLCAGNACFTLLSVDECVLTTYVVCVLRVKNYVEFNCVVSDVVQHHDGGHGGGGGSGPEPRQLRRDASG